MSEVNRCCFCNCEIAEGGKNNPGPIIIIDDEDAYCCNECNEAYVIPSRMGTLNKDEAIAEVNGLIYYSKKDKAYKFERMVLVTGRRGSHHGLRTK